MTPENRVGGPETTTTERGPNESIPSSDDLTRRRIALDEAYAILMQMQREAETVGAIPPSPWLILRKADWLLEAFGGVVVALCLGSLTLLANFLIFNYILHVEF